MTLTIQATDPRALLSHETDSKPPILALIQAEDGHGQQYLGQRSRMLKDPWGGGISLGSHSACNNLFWTNRIWWCQTKGVKKICKQKKGSQPNLPLTRYIDYTNLIKSCIFWLILLQTCTNFSSNYFRDKLILPAKKMESMESIWAWKGVPTGLRGTKNGGQLGRHSPPPK